MIRHCQRHPSNNFPDPPRHHIKNPPTNAHALQQAVIAPQETDIIPNSTLQLRKRLEIKPFFQLPTVRPDRRSRVLIRERQHPAPSVIDQHDLTRAQQVLRDEYRAQGVASVASGVADHVRVAESDSEGGGGVDACVHAGYCLA